MIPLFIFAGLGPSRPQALEFGGRIAFRAISGVGIPAGSFDGALLAWTHGQRVQAMAIRATAGA
ncbi:MAG: hypothetical protein Q8M76_05410 [Spirochaetaceae bacterium]|nr:hypothetical protein [Spirochaetaceae bacterium]